MLKQTIKYTDFFDKPQEEDLYFNFSKAEIAENLWLIERFENLQRVFSGGERQLTIPEVQLIVDLVKDFMRLSYGERSEDGKHFRKGEALFKNFKESAAYDAMLIGMFEDVQKMFDFMLGVLPQDWRQKAEEEAAGRPVPQDYKKKQSPETVKGTVLESVPESPEDDVEPDQKTVELSDELEEFKRWKESQKND